MSGESENFNGEPNSNGNGDDAWRRDTHGRFGPGNKGGPGSPVARHARELAERFDEAIFKTCSPDRLLAMLDAVLKRAEAGDIPAARLIQELIADRDIPLRLERLEELLERRELGDGETDFDSAKEQL
jgi:hypothetical protein